ncbi:hypothetical protein ID0624_14440 [Helicobacter pylori]
MDFGAMGDSYGGLFAHRGGYERYRSYSKHKSFILKQKSGLSTLDKTAVYHYRLSLFRKRRSKWTENK